MISATDRGRDERAGNNAATARLGIIGGGQLARMTALAAAPLGCEVRFLAQDSQCPAAWLAPRLIVGEWRNRKTLRKFAGQVDVITIENEFVSATELRRLEDSGHQVFPTAASVAAVQDKLVQKETLTAAGLPLAAYRAVSTIGHVVAAGNKLGWPLVLKTRRDGYDGKGNFTLHTPADVPRGWAELGASRGMLVEAFWPFHKELAVIVTRGRRGEMACYPVAETIQRNHVCHEVRAPADIPASVAARATEIAQCAVTAVGGIGSFGVEMFLGASGEIAINELAPRVHNSGHYTIEACVCSQFENHVRAVMGWPLGSTGLIAPAAVMINLLGSHPGAGRAFGLDAALRVPGARVHLYGKPASGAGRKMGHVTALGATLHEARTAAFTAADAIHFGAKS
ncbi:MAG: hypothetical protein RIQ93_487 [Verrucomicrobiota bacterium]|jgi:5-(carboxyamino)imidazole ribonucleotide synthase